MKTKAFKYIAMAMIAVATMGLTSCEVEVTEFYDTDNIGSSYYNRSSALCSRSWGSHYRDARGNYCFQQLNFYLDRTGIDYVRVEYPDGFVEETEYRFRWSWDNYAQTSIRMSYGGSDTSYLDDIYIGGNVLNGYLDGRNNFVEFQGMR